MRAFVTGATGYLGRRLVAALLRDGCDVAALVRRDGHGLPAAVRTCRGSLEGEIDSFAQMLRGRTVLFHLGAKISFDPAARRDLLRVNGEGTRRILAAAREAGVQRCIVVSSACTIGLSHDPDDVLDETSPTDPRLERRNPYLHSKRLAEDVAVTAAAKGQHVVIVNPTTVFGPGDRSLNAGTLVRQVATARVVPVPPGGSNVVDCDDVIDGILAASRRGVSGRRYILGGANLRFDEILRHIAEVIGRRPLFIPLPRAARLPMAAAAWCVQRAVASQLITPQIVSDTFAYKFYSSRRAEQELGWRARRGFARTLAAAWDYYTREGLIAVPAGVTA